MKNSNLTVIITASYIKSHPSIELIKATLESLKFINDDHCNILLAHSLERIFCVYSDYYNQNIIKKGKKDRNKLTY